MLNSQRADIPSASKCPGGGQASVEGHTTQIVFSPCRTLSEVVATGVLLFSGQKVEWGGGGGAPAPGGGREVTPWDKPAWPCL